LIALLFEQLLFIDVFKCGMPKKIVVIGSGFSSLSAACFLAKAGHEVTVIEKLSGPGGRARQLNKAGFTFDMGPSWYWMPDVFDRFFNNFGKSTADYYELTRLDPSYAIYFGENDIMKVPAELEEFYQMFERYEPGSSTKLKKFLTESHYKYEVAMSDFVFRPGNSLIEYADIRFLRSLIGMHMLTSISSYIKKYFKNPQLIKLLEFPVLFLGATPSKTPALYSLMNYADIQLGTWYPKGGMFSVVTGMVELAKELGVKFIFNEPVIAIDVHNSKVKGVLTANGNYDADFVVGGADYHHIEQTLLDISYRKYDKAYWDKRMMAPSSLLYFVGVNKKLKNMWHHTLFFDTSFENHASEIYEKPVWPSEPLFYTSCASITDKSIAPEGMENLVFLIPVATGLEDNAEIRDRYFEKILNRFSHLTDNDIRGNIIVREDFAYSDFVKDYNSFKGNAYGLANTLWQTAFLKPKMKSAKVENMYYTGQLTVPGPGVPPSIISGEVVYKLIKQKLEKA
jgi:phytoene desaturase